MSFYFFFFFSEVRFDISYDFSARQIFYIKSQNYNSVICYNFERFFKHPILRNNWNVAYQNIKFIQLFISFSVIL